MTWYILFFIAIVIIVAVVLIVIGTTGNSTKSAKTLYKTCKNNFDCELGFFCELRDHPSDGICVIPPGGACHKVTGNKNDACYSGYYCDVQDGICLKVE
jgi:hypothetical protein